MWTHEKDLMAVIDEAVKNEPPPPPGSHFDNEHDLDEEEQADDTNDVELILKGYIDEATWRPPTELSSRNTIQQIRAGLRYPIPNSTASTPPTTSPPPGCVRPSVHTPEQYHSGSLTSVPLDVFFEIASYLSPLDLLHCARTSKMLRSTLMYRKNCRLWRSALAAVPQLPSCPDDMSEPAYAALLFDGHCFLCGAANSHSIDYALRVRLCEPCWDANVCEADEVLEDIPDAVIRTVTMLTPCESNIESSNYETWWKAEDVDPARHTKHHYYYKPALVSVAQSLWPPPIIDDWGAFKSILIEHVKNLRYRQVHAILVQCWTTMSSESRERLLLNPVRQYEELRRFYVYRDLADVEAEIPPEVREKINGLSTVLYFDHESLQARHKQVLDSRHEKRFAQLEEWYEELLAGPWAHFDQRLYPNRHDGSRLASLSLLRPRASSPRSPYTRGQFWNRDTLRALREAMHFYDYTYANALADIVTTKLRREQGEDAVRALKAWHDIEHILSVPFALFRCTECGEGPLPYPEIHVHWREQHMDIPVYKPDEVLDRELESTDSEDGTHSDDGSHSEDGTHSEDDAVSETGSAHSSDTSESGDHSPISSDYGEYFADFRQRPLELPCPYWVEIFADAWEAQEVILEVVPMPETVWVRDLTNRLSSGALYCACGNPAVPEPANLTWCDFVMHIASELDWLHLLQQLEGRAPDVRDKGPVFLNDHEHFKCIKRIAQGEDTSPAHFRIRADLETRTRIDAHLAMGPQSADIVCTICDALVQAESRYAVPKMYTADDVVYHLKAKHGKDFEEADISFAKPLTDVLRSSYN